MVRWEPDAAERLQRAALDLFVQQGFAQTTVPQITERAGLTTRTFFRYFPDKREVLFSGEDEVRARIVEILRLVPAGLGPMEVIEHGLEEVAVNVFQSGTDDLRARRAVIASDEGLIEREQRKLQLTADTMVAALRERGFDELTSDMTARLAMMILQTAIARWLDQPATERPLISHVRESVAALRSAVWPGNSNVSGARSPKR